MRNQVTKLLNILNLQFFSFKKDMRRDVQAIFRKTPHNKQVMMFSATLSKEIRPVCKKFMQNVRFIIYFLIIFFFLKKKEKVKKFI